MSTLNPSCDKLSPSFSIGAFCEDPVGLCPGVCVGVCANADIAGIGTRIAFFVQALSATFTILWVKDPSQARMVFAIQYLSAMALLISGIVFGYQRQITEYHAILIVYLAEGTAANSVIAAVSGLFPSGRLSLLSNTLIYGFAGLVFWLSLLTRKADFGAQPACNTAVRRPSYDPFVWFGLVLLLVIPSIVRQVKRWRRGRKTRGRAEQPTRAGNDPHFQDIDKRQAAMHTLLSVPFYAYWLYSIHAFIHRQNNILGNAEHQFTQGQTTAIAFSVLSLVPAVQPMYDSLFARVKAYVAGRRNEHDQILTTKPQEIPLLDATTPSHLSQSQNQQTHYTLPTSAGQPNHTSDWAYLEQGSAADYYSQGSNDVAHVPPVWQPSHGTGYATTTSPSRPGPFWQQQRSDV